MCVHPINPLNSSFTFLIPFRNRITLRILRDLRSLKVKQHTCAHWFASVSNSGRVLIPSRSAVAIRMREKHVSCRFAETCVHRAALISFLLPWLLRQRGIANRIIISMLKMFKKTHVVCIAISTILVAVLCWFKLSNIFLPTVWHTIYYFYNWCMYDCMCQCTCQCTDCMCQWRWDINWDIC